MATGYEPSAQRSPGIQPRNDQSVQPRAPRGATNDVKPKNLSSGQGTTLEIAAESHRSVQGKATELHPFGAANREVPVIGQGTCYINDGDPRRSDRRVARHYCANGS